MHAAQRKAEEDAHGLADDPRLEKRGAAKSEKEIQEAFGKTLTLCDINTGTPHVSSYIRTTTDIEFPKYQTMDTCTFNLRYALGGSIHGRGPLITVRLLDMQDNRSISLHKTGELRGVDLETALVEGYTEMPQITLAGLHIVADRPYRIELFVENQGLWMHISPELDMMFYYVPETDQSSSEDSAEGELDSSGKVKREKGRRGAVAGGGVEDNDELMLSQQKTEEEDKGSSFVSEGDSLLPEDGLALDELEGTYEAVGGANEYYLQDVPTGWHGRNGPGFGADDSPHASALVRAKAAPEAAKAQWWVGLIGGGRGGIKAEASQNRLRLATPSEQGEQDDLHRKDDDGWNDDDEEPQGEPDVDQGRLEGSGGGSRSSGWNSSEDRRPVCPSGEKCKDRRPQHLENYAHPWLGSDERGSRDSLQSAAQSAAESDYHSQRSYDSQAEGSQYSYYSEDDWRVRIDQVRAAAKARAKEMDALRAMPQQRWCSCECVSSSVRTRCETECKSVPLPRFMRRVRFCADPERPGDTQGLEQV